MGRLVSGFVSYAWGTGCDGNLSQKTRERRTIVKKALLAAVVASMVALSLTAPAQAVPANQKYAVAKSCAALPETGSVSDLRRAAMKPARKVGVRQAYCALAYINYWALPRNPLAYKTQRVVTKLAVVGKTEKESFSLKVTGAVVTAALVSVPASLGVARLRYDLRTNTGWSVENGKRELLDRSDRGSVVDMFGENEAQLSDVFPPGVRDDPYAGRPSDTLTRWSAVKTRAGVRWTFRTTYKTRAAYVLDRKGRLVSGSVNFSYLSDRMSIVQKVVYK